MTNKQAIKQLERISALVTKVKKVGTKLSDTSTAALEKIAKDVIAHLSKIK